VPPEVVLRQPPELPIAVARPQQHKLAAALEGPLGGWGGWGWGRGVAGGVGRAFKSGLEGWGLGLPSRGLWGRYLCEGWEGNGWEEWGGPTASRPNGRRSNAVKRGQTRSKQRACTAPPG
jgi:hypothetical protein